MAACTAAIWASTDRSKAGLILGSLLAVFAPLGEAGAVALGLWHYDRLSFWLVTGNKQESTLLFTVMQICMFNTCKSCLQAPEICFNQAVCKSQDQGTVSQPACNCNPLERLWTPASNHFRLCRPDNPLGVCYWTGEASPVSIADITCITIAS